MSIVRVQTNSTEVITVVMLLLKVLQTGLGNVLLKIRRTSDDYLFDFTDSTFKAVGWTSLTQAMTEIDAVNLPGHYDYTFDSSAIANPTADDSYSFSVDCVSADNIPQMGEIKVGEFVDDIDAAISTRASEANATINTASIISEVDDNETKIDNIQLGVTEILGLVQSNIRISTVNDASGRMTSGTVRIYPTKADAIADTNMLHEYSLTAGFDSNGYTDSYLSVKDS